MICDIMPWVGLYSALFVIRVYPWDDDMDLGIRPEAYIRAIGGERKFAEKHEDLLEV